MTPPVSIIVPIYNVENYLEECLASIIEQSLYDIEVILVNDASPDNSELIIQKFIHNPQIIYIKHDINKGHGGALNTGLKQASGIYIWFVDSDDFIDRNACQFLFDYAMKHDVDALGIGAHNFREENGNRSLCDEQKYTYPKSLVGKTMFSKDFIIKSYIKHNFLPTPQWAYFFKRTSIKDFSFRENVAFEDHDSVPIIINSLKKVRCINYKPYFRRIHNNNSVSFLTNLSDRISRKQIDQRLDIASNLLLYLKNENINKLAPISYFAFRTIYIDILPHFARYTANIKPDNDLIEKHLKIILQLKEQFQTTSFHNYRRRNFGIMNHEDWIRFGESTIKKRIILLASRILQGTFFERFYVGTKRHG